MSVGVRIAALTGVLACVGMMWPLIIDIRGWARRIRRRRYLRRARNVYIRFWERDDDV